MSCLVKSQEAEVAVLADLTVFLSVDEERRIVAGAKLFRSLVLHGQAYGLPAKPIADVIGVSIDKGDCHSTVDDVFQVLLEICEDEVAC